MDGYLSGWVDGWLIIYVNKRIDKGALYVDGIIDGWMGTYLNCWVNGWIMCLDGWVLEFMEDGWMVIWVNK